MLDTIKYYFLFSSRLLREVNPVFLFFLVPFSLFAQENLVPNGDFEEFVTCPSSDPPYYFVDRAAHWFMPTQGTSDYFNTCSTEFDSSLGYYLFSVPQNYEGYQLARSGNGYAGYYAALLPDNNNYYEYVSVELIRPLIKSHVYEVEFYLSVADSFYHFPDHLQLINHAGVLLSDGIDSNKFNDVSTSTATFVSSPEIVINDSTGWQKISGKFVALGNENTLTIGYFCRYEDLVYNYLPTSVSDSAIAVYFYIDDVSLIDVTGDYMPNVFTPNGDGVNDLFIVDDFLSGYLEIFNRWGESVYKSSSIFWDGGDSSDGVYFYVISDEEKIIQKQGFIELIR